MVVVVKWRSSTTHAWLVVLCRRVTAAGEEQEQEQEQEQEKERERKEKEGYKTGQFELCWSYTEEERE